MGRRQPDRLRYRIGRRRGTGGSGALRRRTVGRRGGRDPGQRERHERDACDEDLADSARLQNKPSPTPHTAASPTLPQPINGPWLGELVSVHTSAILFARRINGFEMRIVVNSSRPSASARQLRGRCRSRCSRRAPRVRSGGRERRRRGPRDARRATSQARSSRRRPCAAPSVGKRSRGVRPARSLRRPPGATLRTSGSARETRPDAYADPPPVRRALPARPTARSRRGWSAG